MIPTSNLASLLLTTARRLPDRPALVWRDRTWTWSDMAARVAAAAGALRARGAKVITVDPRVTAAAADADLHLQPIPGTDGALALGIACAMLEEGLEDREYLIKYCSGVEAFCAYARQFPPARAAASSVWAWAGRIAEASTAANRPDTRERRRATAENWVRIRIMRGGFRGAGSEFVSAGA